MVSPQINSRLGFINPGLTLISNRLQYVQRIATSNEAGSIQSPVFLIMVNLKQNTYTYQHLHADVYLDVCFVICMAIWWFVVVTVV